MILGGVVAFLLVVFIVLIRCYKVCTTSVVVTLKPLNIRCCIQNPKASSLW